MKKNNIANNSVKKLESSSTNLSSKKCNVDGAEKGSTFNLHYVQALMQSYEAALKSATPNGLASLIGEDRTDFHASTLTGNIEEFTALVNAMMNVYENTNDLNRKQAAMIVLSDAFKWVRDGANTQHSMHSHQEKLMKDRGIKRSDLQKIARRINLSNLQAVTIAGNRIRHFSSDKDPETRRLN